MSVRREGDGGLGLAEVRGWLGEDDPQRLGELFSAADRVRRGSVGDAVHLRGLVEISNHCRRMCHYCGLRAANERTRRYRMTLEEIVACARRVADAGLGTVVLQAGEDPGLTREVVRETVRRVKGETGCAVTLSLGERSAEDFEAWWRAGADRYLLRFETSDRVLYETIHPPHGKPYDRVGALRRLREIGYEIGSGVMLGLPGQTVESLAHDLLLMRDLDLDMIGCGPFIPHPETPLAALAGQADLGGVPATLETAFKVVALCRLLVPRANIPATTAVATLGGGTARARALACGANVIMPNFTPPPLRELYEIYEGKSCPPDGAEAFCRGLGEQLAAMGRTLGRGPGGAQCEVGRRGRSPAGVRAEDVGPRPPEVDRFKTAAPEPRPQIDSCSRLRYKSRSPGVPR